MQFNINFINFTETDKENEKLISMKLKKLFPKYEFIGEEEAAELGTLPQLTDKPTWIVDPIDGTTNFIHGFTFSCVSIALVVKQEPVLGVVYNPYLDELFLAVKGKGSYLNGTKLNVSKAISITDALMVVKCHSSLIYRFHCLIHIYFLQ